MDCSKNARRIACSLALVAGVLTACAGPRSTEQSIDLGNHYLEFGEWQKAADAFQPVVQNSPGNWKGEFGYGVAMANVGDLVTARRCLETANDHSPGRLEIITALADVMFRQGDSSQLYQLLNGAGAALGRSEPYVALSLYAQRLKDDDSALQALRSAIEVDSGVVRPRTTECYYQMAMLQLKLGNTVEAVRRLRQAYAIAATDPRVLEQLQKQGIVIDTTTAIAPGL